MAKRLDGRVAFITGASRGIGRAVAERFAQEGAKIIAMARTRGALEELDDVVQQHGEPATLIDENLKNFDALDAIGAALHERFGKLDILVLNGAILGPISPVGHVKPKDWQDVIDVNLTANYRLRRSFDPLLRQSDAGRVIAVTSSAGGLATPAFWGPYSTSKAALEALINTYAAETAKFGICANILDPGGTRTAMRAKAFPGEDPQTLKPPEDLADLFVELAEASYTSTGQRVKA